MADNLWAIVEAVGTAAAAFFAATQIRLSRRDANSRAVLEHLREIDRRVTEAVKARVSDAQAELLEYYRGQRKDLTGAASSYMALLNSLDVLAFAAEKKLVDKEVAGEYLRTLLSPEVVTQTFLKEVQSCCGDIHVYEHLYKYFGEIRWASKERGRLTR